MSKNTLQHVVIIPDGNRRWARAQGMKVFMGHKKSGSYEHLSELFDEAKKLGVKYMSLWGFSTENWKREKKEVMFIMDLISNVMKNFSEKFHEDEIRFRHIGRKDRIPSELADELRKLEEETKSYDKFFVQLFLDYGGRDEILRAVNKMLNEGISEINENIFLSYLDTAGIPEPDLIIRTSGEKRLSGMMPFQSVYSELCFVDEHFPDFGAAGLRAAVDDFSARTRRFGGNGK